LNDVGSKQSVSVYERHRRQRIPGDDAARRNQDCEIPTQVWRKRTLLESLQTYDQPEDDRVWTAAKENLHTQHRHNRFISQPLWLNSINFLSVYIRGKVERRENLQDKCVKNGMKRFGLVKGDAHNLDKWRSLTTGNRPTLPQCGDEGVIFFGLRSRDVKR